ncbi:MAG TPA: transposase [Ktedonobacteraceae bacterium]|nr:transposase [Ktedonobacteraceae bacterium]
MLCLSRGRTRTTAKSYQRSNISRPLFPRIFIAIAASFPLLLFSYATSLRIPWEERIYCSINNNEVFTSLPGAGKRLAPGLLAEWGDDRGRYADTRSVQALAGTAPVPFESGN